MSNKLVAKAEIKIDKDTSTVWDALTNPEMIKKFLFGTEAVSDWKAGSPLNFKGVYEGKEYFDKGTILKLEKKKLLQHTYLSSFSNLEDIPENYAVVTYELFPQNNGTKLTVTQDNNPTEESKNHSEGNWNTVLKTLKELLEKQ